MDLISLTGSTKVLDGLFNDENGQELLESQLLPKKSDGSFDFESFGQIIIEYLANALPELSTQFYTINTKREKSNQLSKRFREQGNKTFSSIPTLGIRGIDTALEEYTKCIAYATPGSEAMAFGYANRSAVLDKVNRPVECLEDIERALQNNYPEFSKPKLLIRRAKCYKELANENYIHAKFWLYKVPLNDPTCSLLVRQLKSYPLLTDREKILDEGSLLPEVKSPSSKYPCASDAVDIGYSRYYGRQIVATRDIDPGEILIVEENFTNYISAEDSFYCCSHCSTFLWNGVPCEHCINVFYCSEKCRVAAWNEYHSTECTTFDLLLQYHFVNLNQAPKLLIRMAKNADGGWQEIKERYKRLPDAKTLEQWPLRDDWYSSDLVEKIFALSSNLENFPEGFTKSAILISVQFTYILATHTDFFGTRYDRQRLNDVDILRLMMRNEDYGICAGLLTRLSFIATFNSYRMTEQDSGKTERQYGIGTSLFFSFLNHSCNPNAWVQQKTNSRVLYALFPIKKGEQVFMHYDDSFFYDRTRFERNTHLLNKYFFTCTCDPCRQHWPTHEELEQYPIMIKSSESKKRIRESLKELIPIEDTIWATRDLSDKEKMLEKLWKMMKDVYPKVDMPCKDIIGIAKIVQTILRICGTTTKLQLKPIQRKY